MQSQRAYLAAIGDVNSPVTWSGIPYHFLRVAKTQGLLDEGLCLSAEGWNWRARRIIWNLGRPFLINRTGGFQYSSNFLDDLWTPAQTLIRDNLVFNCFQLYPPSVVKDSGIEKWFFIDQTLLQLFDVYGIRRSIGQRIANDALKREREGYHSASGIIVHSRWAAESVIGEYGIPAHKVHVVQPGANIEPDHYERWEETQARKREIGAETDKPLRLVFVGKDWRRKGLDRLLRAVDIARRSGLKATLKIIGCRREDLPNDLQNVIGVDWLGFIDKRSQLQHFLETVSECDVGCLPSRAEAGGIALREYHALGLIALGTDAGGAPEHMVKEASITVPADASDEEFATLLLNLESDSSKLATLRAIAWKVRRSVLWNQSVQEIIRIRRSM